MFKKIIIPIIFFLLVLIGCTIVNIKNTEALSPLGNTDSNYEMVTEEFGEDFKEFIKDKADVKIYVNKDESIAEVQIGDEKIKITKSNFFITKIKAIGNFFIKQINNIENSLKKITENTVEEKKYNDKLDKIVEEFIAWLAKQN